MAGEWDKDSPPRSGRRPAASSRLELRRAPSLFEYRYEQIESIREVLRYETSLAGVIARGAAPDLHVALATWPEMAGVVERMARVGHRWREDTVLQIGRAVELALPEISARRPPI